VSEPRGGLPRPADVAIAGLSLLVASPVLLLSALAIKLTSRGPVVYRQQRVGRGGEVFELWKLRTMKQGSDPVGVGTAVVSGDPRVTSAGRVLRRLALDELPNLVNVLAGDLSLVGPRPTVRVQVEQYTARQLGRLAVPPGITGWAQVAGRAALPWHERIELDLWYIEHWSLRLDVRILLRTARLMLSGKGLYRGETGGWRPPDR